MELIEQNIIDNNIDVFSFENISVGIEISNSPSRVLNKVMKVNESPPKSVIMF